jgi:hypothetical protein
MHMIVRSGLFLILYKKWENCEVTMSENLKVYFVRLEQCMKILEHLKRPFTN